MIIPGQNINPLIGEGIIDPKVQIQPAGIDLTLASISMFMEEGILDFSNEKRKLPDISELIWDQTEEEKYMWIPTGAYLIKMDPIVEIPMDMIAFAQPRSSLTRMGCGIHSGIWDPGYKGDSTFVLNVYNFKGITLYKDARLAQLVFIRMEKAADKGYDGVYQGQGIHDNDAPPGLKGKGW